MKTVLGWLWFATIQLRIVKVLIVVGWIVIPIMAALKRYEYRQSEEYDYAILAWRDKWMYVWGNEEDGIDGSRGYQRDPYSFQYYGDVVPFPYGPQYDDTKSWYYKQDPWLRRTWNWSLFRRIYWWSAWRNSVNNLRFLTRWKGGPFFFAEFGKWYVQLGWNSHGFPVAFIGK